MRRSRPKHDHEYRNQWRAAIQVCDLPAMKQIARDVELERPTLHPAARYDLGAYRVDGASALVIACQRNRPDVVRWLLDNKLGDCNDMHTRTCVKVLHYAACSLEAVHMLVMAGSDVWARSGTGELALDVAIDADQLAAAELLVRQMRTKRLLITSTAWPPPSADVKIDEANGQSDIAEGKAFKANDCLDTDLNSLPTEENPIGPYAEWGGWANTLAGCDGFGQMRQQDRVTHALLSKLDALTAARSASDLIVAFDKCEFRSEEVHKLNSPLLDGLLVALSVESDQARGVMISRLMQPGRETIQSLILRCITAAPRGGQFPEAVKFLLQRNGSTGQTYPDLVWVAALYGQQHVLKLLITLDFEVDWLPLHLACCAGRTECVRLLLHHQPGLVLVAGWQERTPLDCAALHGRHDIVALLLPYYAPLQLGHALRAVCGRGHVSTVQLLLQSGVPIDDSAQPALVAAVNGRHLAVAELLLNAGVSTNTTYAPLHNAAALNDVAMAELLLKHGADIEARSSSLSTALHMCGMSNSVDVARLLLQHGAAIRARNDEGWTPLHDAAFSGSYQTARLLIENGASVHDTEDNFCSVLQISTIDLT